MTVCYFIYKQVVLFGIHFNITNNFWRIWSNWKNQLVPRWCFMNKHIEFIDITPWFSTQLHLVCFECLHLLRIIVVHFSLHSTSILRRWVLKHTVTGLAIIIREVMSRRIVQFKPLSMNIQIVSEWKIAFSEISCYYGFSISVTYA